MNISRFLPWIKLGVDVLSPGSVDDISNVTVESANAWFASRVEAEPFPNASEGDNVLSDEFLLDGWGYVWNQRQFWLTHKRSGIKSRWIVGRDAPMKAKLIE